MEVIAAVSKWHQKTKRTLVVWISLPLNLPCVNTLWSVQVLLIPRSYFGSVPKQRLQMCFKTITAAAKIKGGYLQIWTCSFPIDSSRHNTPFFCFYKLSYNLKVLGNGLRWKLLPLGVLRPSDRESGNWNLAPCPNPDLICGTGARQWTKSGWKNGKISMASWFQRHAAIVERRISLKQQSQNRLPSDSPPIYKSPHDVPYSTKEQTNSWRWWRSRETIKEDYRFR